MDGTIRPGEWIDANNLTFNKTTVFVKQDGVNLYIAFNITDATYNIDDECDIAFDVNYDRNETLQTDDIILSVLRDGTIDELNSTLDEKLVSGWTAKANSTGSIWQSEFNITYAKLNITAGTSKTLGVYFVSFNKDLGMPYSWPPSADPESPATWGDMNSGEYNWVPEFSNITYVILFLASPFIFLLTKRRIHRQISLSSTA